VAIFVAVLGGRAAGGLAGFDRAWIVVVITAAITAFAGLATGRRLTGVPEMAATAATTGHAVQARLHANQAAAPLRAGRRGAGLALHRDGGDRVGR
jgi:hypothetical protein